MRKTVHSLTTIILMLAVSRFIIRIIDATVGIDDDMALLMILVLIVNLIILWLSIRLYRHYVS